MKHESKLCSNIVLTVRYGRKVKALQHPTFSPKTKNAFVVVDLQI